MKWKTRKTTWVFLIQKYGKFWNILLGHFIKHKPLIVLKSSYGIIPYNNSWNLSNNSRNIPYVLVICKLQCSLGIDHKFSMHEILDDVTPCFHFHAQPLYHNLDIWPCFGHSKEYDFDNLLPECLFYCKK